MTVRRTQNSGIPPQIEASEASTEIVTNNKDPEGSSIRKTENPFSKDVFEAEGNPHPGLYSDQDFQTRPGQKSVVESIGQKYTMFAADDE